MALNHTPIDTQAIILSLLLLKWTPSGDKYGHPATSDAYMGADLGIEGDDFYDLIEDIEEEIGLKFPDVAFSEICNCVRSEGEVIWPWWKRSNRDISVRELSDLIETKLREIRDARLIPISQNPLQNISMPD